jgi:predicted acetylornithine/succinylornithine family transaminase
MAQKYGFETAHSEHQRAGDLLQIYKRQNVSFVRGKGARLWDSAGKEYVDFVGGIAVNIVGHGNPKLVAAICNQASNLIHTSNLYEVENQSKLASRLAKTFRGRQMKSFFCNSGAEANEAALKFAVKATGRKKFLAAHNSFHGRTLMALSVTGQPKYWKGFEPLIYPGVDFFDYGSMDSLKSKLDADVAAVIIEPIQGEGGVVTPPEGFLSEVSEAVHANGSLLIVDEVQTGMGRTGKMFAHQWEKGCAPDIVTVAKGLAGGVPIGATILTAEVAGKIAPGDHGSTFGGNPLATAAALATLEIVETEGFLESVVKKGGYLSSSLAELFAGRHYFSDVRGKGLMIGAQLNAEYAKKLAEFAFERGFLVNVAHDSVIRLLPPLVVTDDDISALVSMIRAFASLFQ